MNVFIDTCAFIALIDSDDDFHSLAFDLFSKASKDNVDFLTSDYVMLETIFLLQKVIGLSAVKDFKKLMLPIVRIIWIDEKIHNNSLSNLIAAEKKKISLTDYSSFYILDNYNIDKVFTFDNHFK
ncbi:MAG: PIN domain-containing protein, partial [Actinomycetota bacterium]|nr:PIN domain-containing protein [Actinomycetota bacterium]